MIFENHFIGSAPCMPARRDIFTGRMQFLERGWGGIEPFDITLPEMLRKHKIFTHITTDHTHYFEIGGENYCQLFDTWDYHRGQEFDTWVSKIRKPQIDREAYGKKSSQYLLNKTRYAGIVAPYIAGAFGVFLFRQFFLNFPRALDEAAKIDGLTRFGTFVQIYLPLSKPIFATLVVFKTTSTWNEYTWPLIITTNKNMWTVQLALSVFKEEFITQWNYLMAATTLIMLPLLIVYIFMQKYFVEGIVTTGIKG